MGPDVRVKTVVPTPTAVVVAETTWADFPRMWGPMLDAVWSFIRHRAPEGLYEHGHNVMLYKDDVPNVEVGVQVSRPFDPVGQVVPSFLPGGLVAAATHTGPVVTIGDTHAAVREWSTSEGYRPTGRHWEIYGDPNPSTGDFSVEVVWSLEMHGHEHGEDRFGAPAQAAEWDARYGESDGAMWSGRPNGRLVAEVAGLAPGRALDVGCGEGADAIWLAGSGWSVSAIDISDVAVGRAREASGLAGAAVDWVCGDALQTPFAARSFDLVSMQYPALPKAAGDPAVRALLDAVRPGGLLLAVYHDLDDEHREHMRSKGVDPADYVDADDLARLLGDDFAVELHAVEARVDPPPGSPHVADVVLRARRR
jgi:SAM-dependent methyltransferase